MSNAVSRITDSDRARFARFIASKPESGCWEWSGCLNSRGYGCFCIGGKGKTMLAHRVAMWMMTNERPPDDLMVCHACDNPRCVRPDHLFLGTAKDNGADMVAKGRSTAGEKSGRAKLTKDQATSIRLAPYSYGVGVQLAREFGVTAEHVYSIRAGRVRREG